MRLSVQILEQKERPWQNDESGKSGISYYLVCYDRAPSDRMDATFDYKMSKQDRALYPGKCLENASLDIIVAEFGATQSGRAYVRGHIDAASIKGAKLPERPAQPQPQKP